MKIVLWGSAANQVGNDPIDCDSIPCPKITISSTNATKVYNNVDIPEIIKMRARCPYARPPRHITLPIKKGKTPIHIFDPDNRKTISQLLSKYLVSIVLSFIHQQFIYITILFKS
ncbi:hypothetical protein MKX01_003711 [Papaver californicum]|nr:hypothetical protein MKX01_003711 [Papaver californicum]